MESATPDRLRLAAACACGGVTLAFEGAVKSMLLCSCSDCQRATGTGHATVAIVEAAAVTVTGTPRSFAVVADSGATFTRSFCPECGTPLFGRSSRAPGTLMLPVGLFNPDTAWFRPGQMIFARTHREWDMVDPALPRHETYRARRTV